MQELKAKKDFIPLIVTVVVAAYFLFETLSKNYVFTVQQIAGLLVLGVCSVVYAIKLRLGVLTLGLYFLLGWTGAIRLSSESISYSFETGGANLVFYHAHPLMFLLMIFYFIISGKYYFGIARKEYWTDLFHKKKDIQIDEQKI